MIEQADRNWPAAIDKRAMYGVLGEVVRIISPKTESDEVGLLVQAMVMLGNIVERNAYVEVDGAKHYPNIFCVLVGKSAKGRKGTSLGRIKDLFTTADVKWGQQCLGSGLSSGEGVIHAVRDKVIVNRDEGNGRTEFVQDFGIEDKRLCCIETEFGGVLQALRRDGNKLSAVLRDAWDSGNLNSLTKSSPVRASNAHISAICHITKQELLRYLSETELFNGFGNRFLWVSVKRQRILPLGAKLTQEETEYLVGLLRGILESVEGHRELMISEAGKVYWTDLYMKLSKENPGILGAVTSRAEAQIIRMSLIFAIADKSLIIDRCHIEAAEAVWRYSEDSCRWIFGDSTGNKDADRILHELRARPEGVTQTEMQQQLFNRNISQAKLVSALNELNSFGLVTSKVEQNGSKGSIRWFATILDSTMDDSHEVNRPNRESSVLANGANNHFEDEEYG